MDLNKLGRTLQVVVATPPVLRARLRSTVRTAGQKRVASQAQTNIFQSYITFDRSRDRSRHERQLRTTPEG